MELAQYQLMDSAEGSMWWYRALHANLLAELAKVHGRLLDAGCGTGGFLRILGQARPDLALAGIEEADVAISRSATKSTAFLVRGSINALPFASGAFDGVVSADVLCHAGVEPGLALSEMSRVLRPGGRLVINMPAYPWMLSAHDRSVHNVRRTTARALRKLLLDAGFFDPRPRYWNSMLLPLMILQRKILNRQAGAAAEVRTAGPSREYALSALMALERRLPFPLPAGGSVLATAVRS